MRCRSLTAGVLRRLLARKEMKSREVRSAIVSSTVSKLCIVVKGCIASCLLSALRADNNGHK